MEPVRVTAADSAVGVASANISMRASFPLRHLKAAEHAARLARQLEHSYPAPHSYNDPAFHPIIDEYTGYAINAIFTSTATMESTINEIFADAVVGMDGHYDLSTGNREKLANQWKGKPWRRSIDRSEMLDKYAIALETIGKDPQQLRSANVHENAFLLVQMRNLLVHYVPEWQAADGPPPERFKKMEVLKGRFDVVPWMGPGNPFFPDKCLSAGCAEWAVETAIAYINTFFSIMEITKRFPTVIW